MTRSIECYNENRLSYTAIVREMIFINIEATHMFNARWLFVSYL